MSLVEVCGLLSALVMNGMLSLGGGQHTVIVSFGGFTINGKRGIMYRKEIG